MDRGSREPLIRASFVLVLAALVGSDSGAARQNVPAPRAPHQRVPPGLMAQARQHGTVRVLVGLDVPTTPESRLTNVQRGAQRAAIARAQTRVSGALRRGSRRPHHRFAYIPYMALAVDAAELQALAARTDVRAIEIDALATPTLAQSTGLIEATGAWSEGYSGAGWTVAILDTGVDSGHPFLAGKIVSEACYSTTESGQSSSVCPGGAEMSTAPGAGRPCAMSVCGHGTHVAGIAAGSGPAYSGVARDASVISMQVFSAFTTGCAGGATECVMSYTSDQIRALERVYELRDTHNIAAVNMSLGGGLFSSPCDTTSRKAIIDQLRAAGIATVVSSGNDGSAVALSAPACISSTISVGSTTDGGDGRTADVVSAFTNSNPYLTLLAPGETITSSIPGGGFAPWNGTSMAAPHVAGAWAVLKARQPGASVTAIADALVSTGVPIYDPRNGVSRSRIALRRAIDSFGPECTYGVTPSALTFGRQGGTAVLTVSTPTGCSWTAESGTAFINVTGGTSGSGTGQVTVSVGPNASVAARVGLVTIAGTAIEVSQAGVTQGDLGGDGLADLVWQHDDGRLASWWIEGHKVVATPRFDPLQVSDPAWRITGTGDLNRDGQPDLVWRHRTDGRVAVWYLAGMKVTGTVVLGRVADLGWQIGAVGDTNGDGYADLVWQHRTEGRLAVWFMRGTDVTGTIPLSIERLSDPEWNLSGAGDTNGDGKADLLWQHRTNGALAVWYLDGPTVTGTTRLSIPVQTELAWKIAGVGDTSGDGRADLLWQNDATGELSVWFLDGATVLSRHPLSIPRVAELAWKVVGPG